MYPNANICMVPKAPLIQSSNKTTAANSPLVGESEGWVVVAHVLELGLWLFVSVITATGITLLVLKVETDDEDAGGDDGDAEETGCGTETDWVLWCLGLDEDVGSNDSTEVT